MNGLFSGFGGIGFGVMGFLQVAAALAGINHWLGIGTFFSSLIAIIVGFPPLIGTVAGVMGAHYGWGWDWKWALFLYLAPVVGIFFFVRWNQGG